MGKTGGCTLDFVTQSVLPDVGVHRCLVTDAFRRVKFLTRIHASIVLPIPLWVLCAIQYNFVLETYVDFSATSNMKTCALISLLYLSFSSKAVAAFSFQLPTFFGIKSSLPKIPFATTTTEDQVCRVIDFSVVVGDGRMLSNFLIN